MSHPKRYSFWPQIVHLPNGGGVKAEVHFKIEEDGLFVAHQDYAALAAENERLKAIIVDECYGSDAYRKHENEAKRLTAENERLRKAGDAMADTLNSTYTKEVKEMNLCQWAAAKEGRDAK